MWLVKCLKSLVSYHLAGVNMLNNLKNCTTTLPSSCFITFTKIELVNGRLIVSEIVGVFVNTSTPDDKYSLRNRENLPQPIQLKLSKKQKIFSHFFAAFQKSASNVKHFEKKDNPHRLCVSQITDCERCG